MHAQKKYILHFNLAKKSTSIADQVHQHHFGRRTKPDVRFYQ